MATLALDENRRRTRVFRSGNSLAVRLPAGWSKEGSAVTVTREGSKMIVESELTTLADALRTIGPLKLHNFRRPKFKPFKPRMVAG